MITVSIFFVDLRGNKKYQILNRRKIDELGWIVVENVGASIDNQGEKKFIGGYDWCFDNQL